MNTETRTEHQFPLSKEQQQFLVANGYLPGVDTESIRSKPIKVVVEKDEPKSSLEQRIKEAQKKPHKSLK